MSHDSRIRHADYTSISNNVGGVKSFLEHTTPGSPRRAPFRSHGKLTIVDPGSRLIFRAELSPTQRIMEGRLLTSERGLIPHSTERRGKLVMESILETKAATILQFIQGLRGSLAASVAAFLQMSRRR